MKLWQIANSSTLSGEDPFANRSWLGVMESKSIGAVFLIGSLNVIVTRVGVTEETTLGAMFHG